MQKKLLPIIFIVLSLFTIFSIWFYPILTSILGLITLIFSLAMGLSAIFEKYKESENARAKISKETAQFVMTLLLISFLAGLAGLFVNSYVSPIYGMGIGLVCTLLVSFGVGYLVKRGMSRVTG